MSWWTLIVLGLAAVAALLGAAWTDRRNAARREAAATRPPARPIPGLAESVQPTYVWPDAPRSEPVGGDLGGVAGDVPVDATTVAAGWCDDRFVTDPATGWAVVDRPLVLVTPHLRADRELWPVLSRSRAAGRGLVVVARDIAAETVTMLAVNVTHGKVAAVAVLSPDDETLAAIAEITGGAVVDEAALRAGYVPDAVLGHCVTWVSSRTRSWLVTETSPRRR